MGIKAKGVFKGREFSFDLPDGWSLLAMAEPKEVPGLADVGAAVREAMAHPIGMAPLAEIIKGLAHKKTVIISDDQTRPTPVSQILLPLLAELNRLGIADQDIDVVIGVGTHRHPTAEEIQAKLGAEAMARLRVSVHDADAPDLVYKGKTSRGTEVRVNRLVAEAALVIGIGISNPHYFAGYSGGPKMMLPGVSGRGTVKQNHVWAGDPMSDTGVTTGNPVWEDMLETARLEGLTFKIDVVLNSRGEIYKLCGGEVEAQQRVAVEALKEVYGVPVPSRADVVITSGYPLETDLIQGGKAITLAESVAKTGGVIILVSACGEGAGPLMYETLSQRPTSKEVIDWIATGRTNTTGGPLCSRLRALGEKNKRLVVVSEGLGAKELADMDFSYAASVEEAIAEVAASKPTADVIVLPIGGSTYPYLAAVPAAAR